MPTITDATVVAQAYDTSGNGGRKLVPLNDGTFIVATLKLDQTYGVYLYKINNSGVSSSFYNVTSSTLYGDASLATNGENVYLASLNSVGNFVVSVISKSGTLLNSYTVDSGQTTVGKCSIAINEAKTELHAAWASKNSTYPNSFNIRYAKGTINADGTVMWGAVEQVTQLNNTVISVINPSIVVTKNKAFILTEINSSGNYGIYLLTNNFTTKDSNFTLVNSNWGTQRVYLPLNYAQSSPSAIFVPQSINGLANGRIWVAWQGTDAVDTAYTNIRFSYSDDSGVTWSTPTKATNGNTTHQSQVSITANKINEVFFVWQGVDTSISTNYNIRKVKYSSGSLGSVQTITNATNNMLAPNTLYDVSLNFSSPLFIYQDNQNSKVGFYGTWTVTTISPTQGDRGVITNRQSMMTYAITSDGTIGTVTEKINGVTVGTKSLTSGQNTTISITQAQWDNIKYGKYKDINANRNTITIEAQGNTYAYTFDKEPASTSDIISQAKAVKDSAEVSMPAKKKILSDAINSKGGSTNPTDSLEVLAKSINSSTSKRFKTGTIISNSSTTSLPNYSGTNVTSYYADFDMSQLGFVPSVITFTNSAKNSPTIGGVWFYDDYYSVSVNFANSNSGTLAIRAPYNNGVVKIPLSSSSTQYNWVANE